TIEDPATYAALLTPIDPATIAFFINQRYPQSLILLLFIDHISITFPGSRTSVTVENIPGTEDISVGGSDAWDCRNFWGHAAIGIGGYGSLAGWNFCPKPDPR